MLIVVDKSGNGMGIGFVNRAKAEGELTGVGFGLTTFVMGDFNAALTGTFVATLQLVRSYDNGGTWRPVTALGNLIQFTGPCEEEFVEPEPGVLYAWRCNAYTSGTIKYRISQ